MSKGEDTPRHISVEIHLSTVCHVYCTLSGFRQIFKIPEKSFSRTDFFTNSAGKSFFQPERFFKDTDKHT